MRFDADQGILVLSQKGEEPLARFCIDGVACVVVAADHEPDAKRNFSGVLTIAGRSYGVLCEFPAHAVAETAADPVELLTPRELEIALLLATGQGTKAVARRLRISFHTVRVHIARVYAKLGLHKQTELAARIGARFGKL